MLIHQQQTPTCNNNQTVVLSRNGQCVQFGQEVIDLIGGGITTERIEVIADPDHGYRVVRRQESLLIPQQEIDPVLGPVREPLPNAGLIPVVRYLLRKKGLNLVDRPRWNPLPAFKLRQVSHPDLIKFIADQTHGIITTQDKPAIIAEILAAFPGISIRVIGHKFRSLCKCYEAVAKMMKGGNPYELQLIRAGRPIQVRGDEPITGAIFSTFDEVSTAELATADIVIFLDAAECIHKAAQQQALITTDGNFRLFGLAKPSDERSYSPYERAVLMRVFGPEQISLRASGQSRRFVAVKWHKNEQNTIRVKHNDRGSMFRLVWRNKARNQEIARVANQLAAQPADVNRTGANVAVLVDTLYHAAELAKLLPDWPIWAKDIKGIHKMRSSFRTRLVRESKQLCLHRRHIVFSGAAKSYQGAYDLDAVIWAGGSPSVQAIPECWFYSRSEAMKPLAIVDFEDQCNPAMKRWSRSRRKQYNRRDIFEIGTSPTEGRIRRFLNELNGGSHVLNR